MSFSVTAGLSLLLAHRAYACHPALQALYLFFGAMALQSSALNWSSDHRDHHRYVDRSWDPYNIQRGGLWAHVLWLFYREPADRDYWNVPDLKANRLILWRAAKNIRESRASFPAARQDLRAAAQRLCRTPRES